MTRAFRFSIAGRPCFVQGTAQHKATLFVDRGNDDVVLLLLTPAEARAMAVALEAAATHAENVLASGLGESAVS